MEKKKCGCKSTRKEADNKAEQSYPGVAVNVADNDKVNPQLVKEETAQMNNNPRNDQ